MNHLFRPVNHRIIDILICQTEDSVAMITLFIFTNEKRRAQYKIKFQCKGYSEHYTETNLSRGHCKLVHNLTLPSPTGTTISHYLPLLLDYQIMRDAFLMGTERHLYFVFFL